MKLLRRRVEATPGPFELPNGDVALPVQFDRQIAAAMLLGWVPTRVDAVRLNLHPVGVYQLVFAERQEPVQQVTSLYDVKSVQDALLAGFDLLEAIEQADEVLIPDEVAAKARVFRQRASRYREQP